MKVWYVMQACMLTSYSQVTLWKHKKDALKEYLTIKKAITKDVTPEIRKDEDLYKEIKEGDFREFWIHADIAGEFDWTVRMAFFRI